jgi:tol-pal system protein YbgF
LAVKAEGRGFVSVGDLKMRSFKRGVVAAVILAGTALSAPVLAQEQSNRLDLLEQRVKQLTGQVEVLTHEVEQLKAAQAGQKQGAAEPAPAERPVQTATANPAPPRPLTDPGEAIADPPAAPAAATRVVVGADGAEMVEPAAPAAPAAPVVRAGSTQILGTLGTGSSQPGDGGFQGQVLVAPGGDQAAPADGAPEQPNVEPVALAPAETPESLYENSNESLLRRQFDVAAKGFSDFLAKYPGHALAGSAQFWLGETYYQQGDYRQAAQNFLNGYRSYGKSRRAPDSLVKLGMSLARLGQKDQACATLNSVAGEYPTAVDAKRRAATEARRAGC